MALAIALASGCGGGSSPPEEEPPVPEGRIAFQSRRLNGSQDILIVSADGSGLVPITSSAFIDEFGPVLSPDGNRIAFWKSDGGAADIYVVNADGSNMTQLTTDPAADMYPTWSPDGSRIAFVRGGLTIVVMNADGSDPVSIPQPDPVHGLAWSPDGTTLAASGVFLVPVAGGARDTITTLAGASDDPAWSPDGSMIAYGCVTASLGQDICVVGRDGTGDHSVVGTAAPIGEIQPTWSPDGAFIAYAAYRGPAGSENVEIVIRHLESGQEVILAPVGADDMHPSWGP